MPDSPAENQSVGAFDRAMRPGLCMVNRDAARLPGTLANRVDTVERTVAPRWCGRRASVGPADGLIEPVESG